MTKKQLITQYIEYMSLEGSSQYGTAFIVGFGGLKVVEAFYDKFFNK